MKLKLLGITLFLALVSVLNNGVMWASSPPNIANSEEEITVSGTVTDETGAPMIGATVLEKGTSNGVITDVDGTYSITVQENATLVCSFLGYEFIEVEVAGQTSVDIQMNQLASALEEIVVVGYGSQKKRDVTGSIATLDNEKISSIPVSSGVQAMQGQVAGVDIQSTGGRPGQAPTIRIRGRRSISASNDPLFVIDGIPQTSGTDAISDINPQDIQSMEILKDAAATAIYGSRGANGVVIITTKRGTSGRTVVTYDGYYGVTSPITNIDMMNAQEYMAMRRESQRNGWNGTIKADEDVFAPEQLEAIKNGIDTDWLDLVLKNGWQTNHQIGVRGGTAKTQFNFSVGLYDELGIIENMDYKRVSGRLNLDHEISKIFKTGVSFTVSNSIQNWGSSATMGEALGNIPLGVPYNEDGTPRFLPTNDGIRTNPLNEILPGAYVDERKVTRIFAPVYLSANLMKDLKFTSTFGPDIRYYQRGQFRSSLTNDNRGGPADAQIENFSDVGYTLENLLNYNKGLGNSNLGITLLQSIQHLRSESHRTDVANLPYESQLFYNLGTAEVKGVVGSRLTEWSLASFMGRASYEIGGKYMIQATLRADGSSRLSGNKWRYFPGISAGWQIGEDLFSDINWLNSLKLRASYGEVGNTSVNPYQTAGRLARTVYSFGGANAYGFGLNEIPNPDLNWEVSKTFDVGLDYDFLNGRFSGSIDFYRTSTEDILLARNLPPTSGYTSVLQNIGSTQTSGIELGLSAALVQNPDGFNWDLDWNIASYKEKITALALRDENGNAIDDIGNRWFIGQPIRVFFDYRKIGIYQANEVEEAATREAKVPGEIKLDDTDGNGIISANDRVILGTDVPDFFGGLNNTFRYKNLSLSAFIYYRVGQMVYSDFHVGNNSLFARYNNLNVDYWTIDNPSNENPRPNQNQEFPRDGQTRGYFDGSYVKLRNLNLGYTLPSSISSKLNMSKLEVYVSGQNLWFAAKYSTFDREVDDTDTGDLPSLGAGTTPSTKLILFGIKAQF